MSPPTSSANRGKGAGNKAERCAQCKEKSSQKWIYADQKRLCCKCGTWYKRYKTHRPVDDEERKRVCWARRNRTSEANKEARRAAEEVGTDTEGSEASDKQHMEVVGSELEETEPIIVIEPPKPPKPLKVVEKEPMPVVISKIPCPGTDATCMQELNTTVPLWSIPYFLVKTDHIKFLGRYFTMEEFFKQIEQMRIELPYHLKLNWGCERVLEREYVWIKHWTDSFKMQLSRITKMKPSQLDTWVRKRQNMPPYHSTDPIIRVSQMRLFFNQQVPAELYPKIAKWVKAPIAAIERFFEKTNRKSECDTPSVLRYVKV